MVLMPPETEVAGRCPGFFGADRPGSLFLLPPPFFFFLTFRFFSFSCSFGSLFSASSVRGIKLRAAASKSRTEVGDSEAAVGGSGLGVGVGTGVRRRAEAELSLFF